MNDYTGRGINDYTGRGIIIPYISLKDGVNIYNNSGRKRMKMGAGEVAVVDDALRISYGIEIPMRTFEGIRISPDHIAQVLFDNIPEHYVFGKAYRLRAYDALKRREGDCADKTAVGIAIARNGGFQARAVGFDETVIEHEWPDIRKCLPRTTGYAFYGDGRLPRGVVARYATEPETVIYAGDVPPELREDGAIEQPVSDIVFYGIYESTYHALGIRTDRQLTATDAERIRKLQANGVEIDFTNPASNHSWFEVFHDEAWHPFSTYMPVDPVLETTLSYMASRRKEFVELGWNGHEYFVKNPDSE